VRPIGTTLAAQLALNAFSIGDLYEITIRGTTYYLTGRLVDT